MGQEHLRVGIVGLGAAAHAHIAAFRAVKGARVAAVCSRRPEAAAEVESRHGVTLKAYADYAALLADPDIDIVDICTPHHLHAEQAVAAAQAGKHLGTTFASTYEPQFQAFVDGVRAGQPMPRTDFEAAFETHRVVFAADRSAEEGRPVRLSEFA